MEWNVMEWNGMESNGMIEFHYSIEWNFYFMESISH